jgi:hypothetical protein
MVTSLEGVATLVLVGCCVFIAAQACIAVFGRKIQL